MPSPGVQELFSAQGAVHGEPRPVIPARGEPQILWENFGRREGMLLESRSVEAQAEKVLGYVLGNQGIWVAALGRKTGLFRAISAGPEKGIADEGLSGNSGYDLSTVRAWGHAGALMLQATGLDGWMFNGVDAFSVLGARGNPEVPGMGFRYDTDDRWPYPNPAGLKGIMEGSAHPPTAPSIFLFTYLQAHHPDLEFYDDFNNPGSYLKSPAEHMARWYSRGTR